MSAGRKWRIRHVPGGWWRAWCPAVLVTSCRCNIFHTWRQAMAYVCEQLCEEAIKHAYRGEA